jgi:hypothetical protein
MHFKSFSRLLAGLLLVWTYGSAIVSAQSSTQPSLAQITNVLASTAGSGTGGATSLGSVLTEAGSTLEGLISDTIAQLAKWTTLI